MRLPLLLSAVATTLAGFGMAVQGNANAALAGITGNGLFAATVSFLGGLLVMLVVALVSPRTRRGLALVVRLLRSQEVPWWMTLGGLGGAAVVIAQSITVPLFGVAVFTMAFVSGQLAGALVVDNTSLPPGGRKSLSLQRVLGVAVVLVGAVVSPSGVLEHGISWWAPFLPFLAGSMTAFQQAANGRIKLRSASAATATFINFLGGSIFLVAVALCLLAAGVRFTGLPDLPGEWWTLMGGVIGVAFIGITTVSVEHLGVLLLSLTSLFGSLVGSLVIDLLFPAAATPVTWTTYLAMAIVLSGVLIASLPRRRRT